MSRKSLKFLLVLVTVLSLISTFSFATDDTPLLTSEEDDGTVVLTTGEDDLSNEELLDSEGSEHSEQSADINEDVYKIDTDVTISETVNGNVFVIADNLKVTGQIGGDLFVMAKTVDIDGGQIYGNVFALAQKITLNGLIYDLYGACNTLEVKYDGVSYRDLKVVCENATINGVVGKNVNLTVSELLTIKSDAMIYGDLNYTCPNELKLVNSSDENAEVEVKIEDLVTGKINHELTSVTTTVYKTSIMDYVIILLIVLVYTLVIWLIISKFTPKFYAKLTGATYKKMLIALLVGLLGLIAIPIIALILLLTVVGIPVSIALLVVYGLLISFSFSITAITLAGKLAEKVKALAKFNNLFAVIISTIVLWLLTIIPVVGGWISFFAMLCGFGLILMSLYNKKEKKAEVVEAKPEE